MIKNLVIFLGVCGFMLLKTYGDYLEQKVQNLENPNRSAVVTEKQLGEVRLADNRLNLSDNSIAGLCNKLSMEHPRGSKNSIKTAESCQCVIDTLPDYLYAKRADEFMKVYSLRYLAETKASRTTSDWVRNEIYKKFEADYEKRFVASGLTHREYGQGIFAVVKHAQLSCGLTVG